MQKRSTKTHLQSLAFAICSKCAEYSISIRIVWIPRNQNTKADYISNIIDYDDWQTTLVFANVHNTKLRRFNFLFWFPECEGVDAFFSELAE